MFFPLSFHVVHHLYTKTWSSTAAQISSVITVLDLALPHLPPLLLRLLPPIVGVDLQLTLTGV